MSDWEPGDLALCVRDGSAPADVTKAGGVYTVERFWTHSNGEAVLDFVGIQNGAPVGAVGFWGHRASRFRKIRPHTPDAEDAETIRLLNETRVPARVLGREG
jgi:hypothetical protein